MLEGERDEGNLDITFRFKKAELNEFDKLIVVPANNMTRFGLKNQKFNEAITTKILGKPK